MKWSGLVLILIVGGCARGGTVPAVVSTDGAPRERPSTAATPVPSAGGAVASAAVPRGPGQVAGAVWHDEGPRTWAPRPTESAITANDLRTRLYQVADDSMQGRDAASLG